jgi:hypothetical protein
LPGDVGQREILARLVAFVAAEIEDVGVLCLELGEAFRLEGLRHLIR